jgi:hypothetical protein
VICFTEVRFIKNLIPVEESTKNGSFSTLSLSPTVTKTGECSFLFLNKRPKYLQGQPQWQGALTSFTMNGSQNSMFKWSQEVAHTFSQWFSQGTIANHTVEALSCLFSLLWHLWGFDVYRSVDLVDRSEYPTLVMIYGSVKQCEWAGWVPFIASNHPYSLCQVCLFCALADGPRLEPGQSATLSTIGSDISMDTLDIPMARSTTICLSDITQMVYPWSWTVRTSSKNPFAQLVTFELKQINTGGQSTNYS